MITTIKEQNNNLIKMINEEITEHNKSYEDSYRKELIAIRKKIIETQQLILEQELKKI